VPRISTFSLTTPEGLTATTRLSHQVTLDNPEDLFSLRTLSDIRTENGRVTTTTYDASTRRRTVTHPSGRVETTEFDSQGRPISIQADPAYAPLTLTYDAAGRLVMKARGDITERFEYDTLHNLTARTLGGQRVDQAYDGGGHLTRVLFQSGRQLTLGYDQDFNLGALGLPNGELWTLTYTADGRVASQQLPGSATYGFAYNTAGQLKMTTLPSGTVVTTTHDAGGRRVGSAWPEAFTTVAYAGATTRVASQTRTSVSGGPAQTTAYTWDGPLLTGLSVSGLANGNFRYRYDDLHQRIAVSLDGGAELALGRDADGLLSRMGPFAFERGGPASAPSRLSDGQLELSYSYDQSSRPVSRRVLVKGQAIHESRVSHDAQGRVAQRREMLGGTASTTAYRYDADGQLLEVSRDGVLEEKYAYDLLGRRTLRQIGPWSETSRYDAQGRLEQRGSIVYTSNADGQVTGIGGLTLVYSARDELLSVTTAGATITYGYDASGQRVSRTDTVGTTQYLHGNPERPYELSASRAPDGTLTEYFYDLEGRLFAFRRAGAWYYVATDPLGSPRVVTDAAGAVVLTRAYDAFGVSTLDSTPAFDLPVGFAGGLWEPVTGLVRFGRRDYEPAAGRWLSRDPLLLDGGQFDPYGYCDNDPVGRKDPAGQLAALDGAAQVLGETVADFFRKLFPPDPPPGGGGSGVGIADPTSFVDSSRPSADSTEALFRDALQKQLCPGGGPEGPGPGVDPRLEPCRADFNSTCSRTLGSDAAAGQCRDPMGGTWWCCPSGQSMDQKTGRCLDEQDCRLRPEGCGPCACTTGDTYGTCGETVCARGGAKVCTGKGWRAVGPSCGDDRDCSCAGLVSSKGNTLVTSECGALACGENGHRWICTVGDWLDTDLACDGSEPTSHPDGEVLCPRAGVFCGSRPEVVNGNPNVLYTCKAANAPPTRVKNCQEDTCKQGNPDACVSDDDVGDVDADEIDLSIVCDTSGLYCGTHHMTGGKPGKLYACDGKDAVAVPHAACTLGCTPKDPGTEDDCKGEVPLVGGAKSCAVTTDDRGALRCPQDPKCYPTTQTRLPFCGKHLMNLLSALPQDQDLNRVIRHGNDADNANVLVSNLYLCEAPDKPPRLAPRGDCLNQNTNYKEEFRGCRSRGLGQDDCCTILSPGCDLTRTAPSDPQQSIGDMAVCFGNGMFCGKNTSLVQFGAPETLYDCTGKSFNYDSIAKKPNQAIPCAGGCERFAGAKANDDACATRCKAVGAFCGTDLLSPGHPAVENGLEGFFYYCSEMDKPPSRVTCDECKPGGKGSAYVKTLQPGQVKTCQVLPFCGNVEGTVCGRDARMMTAKADGLYRCQKGRAAMPLLQCAEGKCHAEPSPIQGGAQQDACEVGDQCPLGLGKDGAYVMDWPADSEYAQERGVLHFCNGHVVHVAGDNNPNTLYACRGPNLAPEVYKTCNNGCEISSTQLQYGDHNGCRVPEKPGYYKCNPIRDPKPTPGNPDLLNYSVAPQLDQDNCVKTPGGTPKACPLGPTCRVDSATPVCGRLGVACGDPNLLYDCSSRSQRAPVDGYPKALPVAACGTCVIGDATPDRCLVAGESPPLLCLSASQSSGYYCGGSPELQGGESAKLYYCDFPKATSGVPAPVRPASLLPGGPEVLGSPPVEPLKPSQTGFGSSLDCRWFLEPGKDVPATLCYPLPAGSAGDYHLDSCNNPRALLANAWPWWTESNRRTRVFDDAKTTWDTDMVPTGDKVEMEGLAYKVKVFLPHPSLYLGKSIDGDGTAPWGYAPRFFDLQTRRVFTFYHLRKFDPYKPAGLTLCQTYLPGTEIGYMGGADPATVPQDAETGFSKYSSGAHLCVQYRIQSTDEVDWAALVGNTAQCVIDSDKSRVADTCPAFFKANPSYFDNLCP